MNENVVSVLICQATRGYRRQNTKYRVWASVALFMCSPQSSKHIHTYHGKYNMNNIIIVIIHSIYIFSAVSYGCENHWVCATLSIVARAHTVRKAKVVFELHDEKSVCSTWKIWMVLCDIFCENNALNKH